MSAKRDSMKKYHAFLLIISGISLLAAALSAAEFIRITFIRPENALILSGHILIMDMRAVFAVIFILLSFFGICGLISYKKDSAFSFFLILISGLFAVIMIYNAISNASRGVTDYINLISMVYFILYALASVTAYIGKIKTEE